jgi:hypothetical protein
MEQIRPPLRAKPDFPEGVLNGELPAGKGQRSAFEVNAFALANILEGVSMRKDFMQQSVI